MCRIILSDIFWKTQALDKLRRAIGADVGVVDPYDGEHMDFHTDKKVSLIKCGISLSLSRRFSMEIENNARLPWTTEPKDG